ncbi:cytochrome P450 4V2-like isoform X2 [Chrysoperla carnea]|uniref:cytochrome P450 4V2-like isoform X2 n=1 Tax=Chrysoperla carnea TaxID=189513 RepID=UPI001D069A58|nr:cytochrome P450 4V2-like isoform X2 [Chrysoperla carnea]
MILTILSSLFTNHVHATLIISIFCLLCVYFSNFIRMCYYIFKISGPPAYPIIGNALLLKGSHEEITKRMFQVATEYGPISRLWFGPVPILLTNEPKIIQELLNNPNALEKAWLMKLITKTMIGNAILISDVPQWKRSRKIIIKGFTLPILKAYFQIFADKINILTEILDIEVNKETTFDINKLLAKTALDSVCASSMGVDMKLHEGDSSYFESLYRSNDIMMRRLFNPLTYTETTYKWTQGYRQLMKCKDTVWLLASKIISEKRNKYNDENKNNVFDSKAENKNAYKKPLLEYMIDFTKNNPDFTDEQLADEINFILITTFDTTAKTISMVLLLLALYKDEQQKVCDELFKVLGNRDKIDFDDLSKLSYMEMVIKETMRLFPVVPLIARQLTESIDKRIEYQKERILLFQYFVCIEMRTIGRIH